MKKLIRENGPQYWKYFVKNMKVKRFVHFEWVAWKRLKRRPEKLYGQSALRKLLILIIYPSS